MSANRSSGLGRGFDSLIPTDFDKSLIFEDEERIKKIAIDALHPNPQQPRQNFGQSELEQLAASVKHYGVLQPLVVTKVGKGYGIIAGERRWRAAQIAGLKEVPAVVRSSKEQEQLEIAIIENVQRVDLSPLEQAVSIERLHQQFNMTYELIGQRLGKASTTVQNIVRLLQLPEEARQALQDRKITEGHARSILALKHLPEKQTELLESIIKHGWSVRQAERFVVSVKDGYKEKDATKQRMQTETPETKKLSRKIGVPVQIRRMAKGGKLEITFTSDDELEKVLKRLS